MEILNSKEIDEWVFEQVQVKGHDVIPVTGKDPKGNEIINLAWKNGVTGETFDIKYKDEP